MKLRVRNPKDFWSGVFFAVVGAAAALFARRYNFGTAARMGPGFFPTMLGGLLTLLGVALALRSLRLDGEGERILPLAWRPVAAVLGSVVLFAVLLRPLGMVLSSLLLVVFSSLGGRDFRSREVVVSALLLTGFCVLVFSVGLKLDLPLWPAAFGS
jgi:putative tricarboxylic transport membrane protein